MTREDWEDWKANNRNDFDALINLANDEGCEEVFDDLIANDDELDDFVRNRLDSGGWQGVACCISDIINCMNDDYYEIDGYGNLRTCDSWDSYAEELESKMDFEVLTCDKCNEEVETIRYPEDWCKEQGLSDEFQKKLAKYLELSKDNFLSDWRSFCEYCEDCFNELKKLVEGWDGETPPYEYEESLEEED